MIVGREKYLMLNQEDLRCGYVLGSVVGSIVKTSPPGSIGSGARAGDEMTNAKKQPGKKVLGFPGPQDSVETKLLHWVRGIILSNDQLVDALERLRSSYILLHSGKIVTDITETLWQVEVALRDAERSRSALASKSPLRPGGA
jgi:hypothetical protein